MRGNLPTTRPIGFIKLFWWVILFTGTTFNFALCTQWAAWMPDECQRLQQLMCPLVCDEIIVGYTLNSGPVVAKMYSECEGIFSENKNVVSPVIRL